VFATLVGALPDPPDPPEGRDPVRPHLAAQLRAQLAAGLDLLSFEEARSPDDDLIERWRRAAATADGLGEAAVKAAFVGPYTSGGGRPDDDQVERARAVLAGLLDAGCPLVEVHEPAAVRIGSDERRRSAFRTAHERLVDGLEGHACLAITGGNADTAGPETILVPGYRSYLFDLIAGPDNWRLVVRAPPTVGIVAAALDRRPGVREKRDVLVWAAHYAASTRGRGLDRVGLATTGSLAGLAWDEALERIALLGEASRTAVLRGDDLGRALDPRNVDARSAALGRYAPARRPGTGGRDQSR
jgi:hypothetical protein